jgi:all-trans-8'-apo-beta-carotenal 15,15'-oxygenase
MKAIARLAQWDVTFHRTDQRKDQMHDYAPLLERAFSCDLREQCYIIEEIEGAIPDFIRGTYYLNGPARFARAGLRYRHWLDGDGMVCALRFERQQVSFTNRFVRSHKFTAEEDAGHPIFRTFGTAFEADQIKRGITLESPVNVSVYPYRGTLLAFGEQGLPWELDPATLETRGEFTFGGRLNEVSPFAAHPKFDAAAGEMFNFGVSFSAMQPTLHVYRFDAQAQLLYRKRLPLDYPGSVHDFTLSPSYTVFYLSPYLLDMETLRRQGRTLMDSLRWEPERGSRLLIVSRKSGEAVASIGVGQHYCLHLINGFEAGNRLMVDVVEYDRPLYDQYQVVPDLFTEVSEGQPVRFVVDMQSRELLERRAIDYRLAPDFPSIDPRHVTHPYRDVWMLGISATGRCGRKFFDQLVHADWAETTACDIYRAPAMHYLGGEPMFIGDPSAQRTGAIICQVFDAEHMTSAFALFDAFHVASGPLAMLRLRDPLPLLFHTSFHRA